MDETTILAPDTPTPTETAVGEGSPAPAAEPAASPSDAPAQPALSDERVAALASMLTDVLTRLVQSRAAILKAFTPEGASRLTAMASDHYGLADATLFAAPSLALAGQRGAKAVLASGDAQGIQQTLGSQYKLTQLSPTAMAEQLANEPALLGQLRNLAPTLDVIETYPLLAAALEERSASGSDTATVSADGLRDFLTGK